MTVVEAGVRAATMPLDGLALTKPMRGKGRPFVKGGPGGPGRPKGSRHRLSEAFLRALAEHFEEHGAEVIRRVAEEHPVAYVRLMASLVVPEPAEVGGGAPGFAERLARALRQERGVPEKSAGTTSGA